MSILGDVQSTNSRRCLQILGNVYREGGPERRMFGHTAIRSHSTAPAPNADAKKRLLTCDPIRKSDDRRDGGPPPPHLHTPHLHTPHLHTLHAARPHPARTCLRRRAQSQAR
eukprot:365047-Chlamydomonas_euryale.AAC.7